ncbi:MAG TPA: RIO1 family regulatory kinase/ATPase [Nocardioidaceae bacterium]|nr:RIO1 family regulatory kinase/ATPase [Nocardioidaceae bacterium]
MSSDVFFEEPDSSDLRRLEPAHEPASRAEHTIDPRFVFDFQPLDDPDDADHHQGTGPGAKRWSTYWDVERLCRGPEPLPDWVVTDRAAVDTELGVLKTGKEADVFLLERSVPTRDGSGAGTVMAAKRYRSEEHRSFHRSSAYTEGRRTRNSRDARAMAKRTAHGRAVAAGQWASAEWEAMKRFWSAGVPVPYPVQIDGTEILMELVTVGDEVAPRLAQARPERDLLAAYFDQLRDAMAVLAGHGIAHGDLSPYNVLAAGERVVIIDLPQAVDIVGNPAGMDFLMRDCHNICTWFNARGLEVDEHALFAELLASAF